MGAYTMSAGINGILLLPLTPHCFFSSWKTSNFGRAVKRIIQPAPLPACHRTFQGAIFSCWTSIRTVYLHRDAMDLSRIPLTSNPDGTPPNFTGGQSLETVNLVVGTIIIALSAIVVSIRIYAGYKNVGRLFLDDLLCLTAEITTVVYFALFSASKSTDS
ncbi:hypothetical protein J3F83DRAFT_431262 [Trichoderma novae-zelandiae]